MEWYQNGVKNAIVEYKQKRALFVVYVKDDSEDSRSTDSLWDSEEVLSVLATNSVVAIQITKDTMEFNQFSQFFPVLVFPSVFCIGLFGEQLVVANGRQTVAQLRDVLVEGFKRLRPDEPEADQVNRASGSVPSTTHSPALSPQSQAPPSPPSAPTSQGQTEVRENAQEQAESDGASGSGDPEEERESLEERTQRCQEKIAHQRAKKAEQEKEHEKNQEINRRQTGQDIARFRREQEARRNQDWIKERQKQKEEERRARQEIREKLEQDRRERMSRSLQSSSASVSPSTSTENDLRQRTNGGNAPSRSNSGQCRVQVKLPGGGSTIFSLTATDTVAALRKMIAGHMCDSEENIKLTCTYPRRDLVSEGDSQTLAQVGLSPTGVVIARLGKAYCRAILLQFCD